MPVQHQTSDLDILKWINWKRFEAEKLLPWTSYADCSDVRESSLLLFFPLWFHHQRVPTPTFISILLHLMNSYLNLHFKQVWGRLVFVTALMNRDKAHVQVWVCIYSFNVVGSMFRPVHAGDEAWSCVTTQEGSDGWISCWDVSALRSLPWHTRGKRGGGRGVGYITVVSFKGYIHFKVNAHVTNNVFVFYSALCQKSCWNSIQPGGKKVNCSKRLKELFANATRIYLFSNYSISMFKLEKVTLM